MKYRLKILLIVLVPAIIMMIAVFILSFPYSLLPFMALHEKLFVMSDSEILSVTEKAIQTKDIFLCRTLPRNKGWGETPIRDCDSKVVRVIENTDLCFDYYHGNFDIRGCIVSVAISKNNLDDCDRINDLNIYKFKDKKIRECYSEVLIKNNRYDECNMLSLDDLTMNNEELDKCYYEYALYEENIIICNKISSESLKKTCEAKTGGE